MQGRNHYIIYIMGSYANLSVKNEGILYWKNGLNSFIRKLFTKDDFLDLTGNDAIRASQELGLNYSEDYFEVAHLVVGVSNVKTIRQRLLVCGFNLEYAEKRFAGVIETIKTFFDETDDTMKEFYCRNLKRIKHTFDLSRIPKKIEYDDWDDFYNYADDWTLFLSYIYNRNLQDEDKVILDLTDLIDGGWLDGDSDFSQKDFVLLKDVIISDLPIILTEGVTDRNILSKAFKIFYPRLTHCIKFLNQDFKPEGGATNILKMARSFASAGISNRILVVLDNDSAAISAMKVFGEHYPSNIRVTTYPYNANLEKYPTIGPQGETQMNINGLAGSIEMYAGKEALTDIGGTIEKIQWTGYIENIKQYQGSLINKTVVQKRLYDLTDDSIRNSSDLQIVCDHILNELGKIPSVNTII